MSEIRKLVEAIENYNDGDLCLGTLRSLKKIKDESGILESKLADKERQLAEARAEIERLALEIENQQYTITCASEENQQLKESLSEARADIDALRMGKMSPCDYYTSKESEENLCRELAEARADLRLAKNIIETHVERVAERDKLIAQMRALIESEICKPCTTMRCDICKFQAALLAAERMGK